MTDQTQGNWNGIVGRVELQAQWKKLNIRQVRIRPDIEKRSMAVRVELENHFKGVRVMPIHEYGVRVEVRPFDNGQRRPDCRVYTKEADKDVVEFEIPLDGYKLWDEFQRCLYQLKVMAGDDVYETTFGLRDIKVKDGWFETRADTLNLMRAFLAFADERRTSWLNANRIQIDSFFL